MTNIGEPRAQVRDERFRSMPLDEVQAHLAKLTERFVYVESFYTGSTGDKRRRILDCDLARLSDAFYDLVPMSYSDAVRAEMAECKTPQELAASTREQIGALGTDIALLLSRFPNSGYTLIAEES